MKQWVTSADFYKGDIQALIQHLKKFIVNVEKM